MRDGETNRIGRSIRHTNVQLEVESSLCPLEMDMCAIYICVGYIGSYPLPN